MYHATKNNFEEILNKSVEALYAKRPYTERSKSKLDYKLKTDSLKDKNKLKGNCFEMLVEILLWFKDDVEFTTNKSVDKGIDGFLTINDIINHIQIKYRTNGLSDDDIDKLDRYNKRYSNRTEDYIVIGNFADDSSNVNKLKDKGIEYYNIFNIVNDDNIDDIIELVEYLIDEAIKKIDSKTVIRKYQRKIIKALMEARLGICSSAPGTGKTTVQAHCLNKSITELEEDTSVNLVLMPTKSLCIKNSLSIKNELSSLKQDVRCLIINSDKNEFISTQDVILAEGQPFRRLIKLKISEEALLKEIESAKADGTHLIIFCTYSHLNFPRIINTVVDNGYKFNHVILDEAHHILNKDIFPDYERLIPIRFF